MIAKFRKINKASKGIKIAPLQPQAAASSTAEIGKGVVVQESSKI